MKINKYYDPLYGSIDLHPLVADMISRNPEIIRLKSIGLMNFRSLSMLPLTSITRLEHTIGITHLVSILSGNSEFVASNLQNFLTAALYHDVNCASFGHAVEWAISRFRVYDHEKLSAHNLEEDKLLALQDKPIYFSQDGLHRFKYKEEYVLDFSKINDIISGKLTCVINSSGIDLDNIDNVSRMAFYLGLLKNKNLPVDLVTALSLSKSKNNFLIKSKNVKLIKEWLDLRSEVYRKFIYSPEYMAFEYLVFSLVRQYADSVGVDQVRNLFHFTDERLLWFLFEKASPKNKIKNIAQRLLLHNLPECFAILQSECFKSYGEVQSPTFCDTLLEKISSNAVDARVLTKDQSRSLGIHITSDDRKTVRSIKFATFVGGDEELTTIGEDRQFILFALLGDFEISERRSTDLTIIACDILKELGLPSEVSKFSDKPHSSQMDLF